MAAADGGVIPRLPGGFPAADGTGPGNRSPSQHHRNGYYGTVIYSYNGTYVHKYVGALVTWHK